MSENHYEIVNDFNSNIPNADQLLNEINNNIVITTEARGIRHDDNDVYIIFVSIISQSEIDELDIIISNHIPSVETNETLPITPRVSNVKTDTYRRVSTFGFPGSTFAKANSISYMATGITSYDIRIIDKKNGEVLLTTNLNNTNESRQELGILSNLSKDPAVFQVFVKKNGGNSNKRVYIENINIEYVSTR